LPKYLEEKGEIKAFQRAVLEVIQARFGAVPPQIDEAVNAGRGIKRLQRCLRQAVAADTLDELQPPPKGKARRSARRGRS
jgi:hypothetical protein